MSANAKDFKEEEQQEQSQKEATTVTGTATGTASATATITTTTTTTTAAAAAAATTTAAKHNHVITLVQTMGIRPYQTFLTTINQVPLATLKFPMGMTLLMSPSDPLLPATTGEARVDVHRKFLPIFGKFLHWISFWFPTTRVKAQIMRPNRTMAAYDLVRGGAAAVFINSPFRTPRRTQVNKRRTVTAR